MNSAKFFLSLVSLLGLLWFFHATSNISNELSPQGCRMSRMWPSYILQTKFDTSWTPLAQRYRLFLYREKEQYVTYWQPPTAGEGLPVLFIPGNAGAHGQARSIASSAARQYFASPDVVSDEFSRRGLKSLDFFAVDFNEDLSAFHGPTIESEISYTSKAIEYILSLYPAGTQIIIMGHSMGGIVASSLLPSNDISAIITMSTPHTLPPARFDARIDGLYDRSLRALDSDPTPILSICGGATDLMIPSESCILPTVANETLFRRTVFSSALEGAWTGVGHREMVWCHQVRWRIARAALELGTAKDPSSRALILDRWLRDGHIVPAEVAQQSITDALQLHDPHSYEVLPKDIHLVLKNPKGSHTYLLPVSTTGTHTRTVTFVLYISQGSIGPVSPQNALNYKASVYHCLPSPADDEGRSHPRCRGLKPETLKLIPNPVPGRTFPVPDEGSDESEGVVLYEAALEVDPSSSVGSWVAVKVEEGDGNGWIVGGFVEAEPLVKDVSNFGLLFGGISVGWDDHASLKTTYRFPSLTSNALVVYSLVPKHSNQDGKCPYPLLAPLISHTSHLSETHYYPLSSSHAILLHTHATAPYISRQNVAQGVEFSVYSSGSAKCRIDLDGFVVRLDWTATMGRWTSRYFTTVIAWSIGLVVLVLFESMKKQDHTGNVPTVGQSLEGFARRSFPKLVLVLYIVALLPLPELYLTGNRGAFIFAFLSPLFAVLAMGLVCTSWAILIVLLWPLRKIARWSPRRNDHIQKVQQGTVISMLMIFVLIFLFIPWQVAYLGCWLIQLYTCARLDGRDDLVKSSDSTEIPLLPPRDGPDEDSTADPAPRLNQTKRATCNENRHLLLLMTWLLPLAAPVLVVWIRTLATAGITTPFNGDHDFFNVAPFLVLVDFASWNQGVLFERQSFEDRVSVRWTLPVVAGVAFLLGPRKASIIYDLVKVAVGFIVIIRIGRRYWGRPGWSSRESN